MTKIYFLLLLLFTTSLHMQAQQTASCTAGLEYRDSVSRDPFAHYVTFKAKASHPENKAIKKVCWRFGDGNSECREATGTVGGDALLQITYKYGPSSAPLVVHTACVVITYVDGCVAEKCVTVYLQYPNTTHCEVDVRAEHASNSGDAYIFVAKPHNSAGKKPLSICWKFGDGTPDECRTYASTYTGTYVADHRFKNPGTYEVCAIVKFDGGCEARKCIKVVVPGTNTATCAVGIRSESIASSQLVKHLILTQEHSGGKKPVKVCWKFGDGTDAICKTYASSYTGTYIMQHAFPRAGQYSVCVEVEFDGGCKAFKCATIIVAGTNTPTECSAGLRIQDYDNHPRLRKLSAIPIHPTHKKPVEICWKFGDGTPDVCKTYGATYTGSYVVEHQYAKTGKFEACVIIKYEDGCVARKCEVVEIENDKHCEVKLAEVATNVFSAERRFYLGLMTNQKAAKVCWNFGDGSDTRCVEVPDPATELALTAKHRFPGPGKYKVCVRVVYANGCVAEKCLEVLVRSDVPETCGGYITFEKKDDNAYVFRGFSIPAGNDPNVQYHWNFGDGHSASGKEVKHQFANGGSYNVCLTIRTGTGCEVRICQKVTVHADSRPQLILTPNPATVVLHALFFSTRNEIVSIRIFNANGLLVKSFARPAVRGENKWDLEIGTLPQGVYSVIVQSNYQFANAIFFKQ